MTEKIFEKVSPIVPSFVTRFVLGAYQVGRENYVTTLSYTGAGIAIGLHLAHRYRERQAEQALEQVISEVHQEAEHITWHPELYLDRPN